MNPNESPLIPQGSFMEQKNKGRARVKIAVFVVLAIHGIGLMALLMQGCKPSTTKDLGSADTNVISELSDTNMPIVEDTNYTSQATSNEAMNSYVQPAATNVVTDLQPVAPATVTEHKIVKGDSFAKLATEYHVSTAAIQAANPGVESTKLQIGQTIKIPAPTTASSVTTSGGAPSSTSATGSTTYTVKSGDTLIRIGNQFGVTAKAIRTENHLTTDKIRVGQKLRIPVKAGAPVATSATDAGTGATSAPAGSR
jgi:LysM repeat protein